jgi:hypothetical protein
MALHIPRIGDTGAAATGPAVRGPRVWWLARSCGRPNYTHLRA